MGHRIGRSLGAALLMLVVLSLAAAPVLAAPDPAVVDCTEHNQLTRHYTVPELRHALATMSADVKEYTSCSDVIQRTLDGELSGLHVGGSGGSGGGSFLPLPLIIVLVVLLLGGAGYGALLLRRRAALADGEPDPGDEPPTRI